MSVCTGGVFCDGVGVPEVFSAANVGHAVETVMWNLRLEVNCVYRNPNEICSSNLKEITVFQI